jgi:hypothetical protein
MSYRRRCAPTLEDETDVRLAGCRTSAGSGALSPRMSRTEYLPTTCSYEDLGPDHFVHRRPEVEPHRLIKRLADLGFSVELKPVTAAS